MTSTSSGQSQRQTHPTRPVATASELIPPASHLRAFNLLDGTGKLKNRPCAVHCQQCAQRDGSEGVGMLLCVKIADSCGNTVVCYYHSKGKDREGNPRGRWLLACLKSGAAARVVCDRGHACDIIA